MCNTNLFSEKEKAVIAASLSNVITLSNLIVEAMKSQGGSHDAIIKGLDEKILTASSALDKISIGSEKIKLVVVDEKANSLHESLGVSNQRADDLADQMDVLMAKHKGEQMRLCIMLSEIAGLCDNIQELVYCVLTHQAWLEKRQQEMISRFLHH
jgi:hypothetical protein